MPERRKEPAKRTVIKRVYPEGSHYRRRYGKTYYWLMNKQKDYHNYKETINRVADGNKVRKLGTVKVKPYTVIKEYDEPEKFFRQLKEAAVEEIELNEEVMSEEEIKAWKKVK